MIDDTSVVMGTLWTAEEFSVLTISSAFIIQVILEIVTLFVVFYLDVESWKEFLMFLVMTIVASLFVSFTPWRGTYASNMIHRRISRLRLVSIHSLDGELS